MAKHRQRAQRVKGTVYYVHVVSLCSRYVDTPDGVISCVVFLLFVIIKISKCADQIVF